MLAVLGDLLTVTDLPGWASAIPEHRRELAALLSDHGLVAAPSDAPWRLVNAPGLRARLAPHGVVVRDCTSFGLANHVRIAVPDESSLARLADTLDRSAL